MSRQRIWLTEVSTNLRLAFALRRGGDSSPPLRILFPVGFNSRRGCGAQNLHPEFRKRDTGSSLVCNPILPPANQTDMSV